MIWRGSWRVYISAGEATGKRRPAGSHFVVIRNDGRWLRGGAVVLRSPSDPEELGWSALGVEVSSLACVRVRLISRVKRVILAVVITHAYIRVLELS
jgi:hypothetical protein